MVGELTTRIDQLGQRINELEDAITPFVVWALLRREEPNNITPSTPILEAKAPLVASDKLYTVKWQSFLDAYKALENAENTTSDLVDNCAESA